MLRPKLRPTLSRRTKYWGITPTAHRKLNKEARRGSHDLRRLVGHANFLDVLIDELDDKAEEEEEQQATAVSPVHEEPSPTEEVEELVDDNGTESDSEGWSDDEDDEDHSLSRTMSKRPDSRGKDEAYDGLRISPSEDGGGYFQHATHGAVEAISPSNVPDSLPNDDKDGAISVTVTHSLVELMDNLGREVTEDDENPLASPTGQVLVDARQSVAEAIKGVDIPN